MNLSKAAKIIRLSNAVAAGTTTINGTSVDMKGFDAVQFIVALGTIVATGVPTLKAQQSSDNGSSDTFADLAGTGVAGADDDDNKLLVLDINEPRERYVRPVLTRATANITVDGIIALLYRASQEPVTHDASVAASEHHHAPAEGTA